MELTAKSHAFSERRRDYLGRDIGSKPFYINGPMDVTVTFNDVIGVYTEDA